MLDLKEGRKYEQLRKLGQELHIPIPEAFWELEVRDKNGKVLKSHKQRSHSWTRNAYNHMCSNLLYKDANSATYGAGLLSLKTTAGAVIYGANPIGFATSSLDGTGAGIRTPAADATRGIVVGSGTAAESFEDYALQTKVAEGTAAGQLSHILSEAHAVSYDTVTRVFQNKCVRYLNNNSGGDIALNEVAIYCGFVEPAIAFCCISRDLLAVAVTVPNTGQLKVTYTIQLTYPA